MPLKLAPGTTFSYSNLGAALLGQGLAFRAGVPYEELLSREVIAPLGLRHTFLTPSPEQVGRTIQAYQSDGTPVPAWDLDALAPAGSLRSSRGV